MMGIQDGLSRLLRWERMQSLFAKVPIWGGFVWFIRTKISKSGSLLGSFCGRRFIGTGVIVELIGRYVPDFGAALVERDIASVV